MDIVLDASVIIKWFLDEDLSSVALDYRRRSLAASLTLIEPELIFYECANVLVHKSLLSLSEINSGMEILYQTPFQLHSFDKILASKSVNYAHKYRLSIYDAAYVALAHQYNCRFVTADQKLYRALQPNSSIQLLKGL